jgi:hypothetical protein
MKKMESCIVLFSAEACWLLSGRSPGLEVAVIDCIAALPSPAITPSGTSKQLSSLTVAEPRRLFTGLPCYALAGT